MVIQRYSEFKQQTTTTTVPELKPLFGTEEPQGQERAIETNSTPQARIETEEMPIPQEGITTTEVSAQKIVEIAPVATQPPPVEPMETKT